MAPIIGLVLGLFIGFGASPNPAVAFICGGFLALLFWALTGFKIGNASATNTPSIATNNLSDEALVQALKSARTDLEKKAIGDEIVKRQIAYEANKGQDLRRQSVVSNTDDGTVITEKAFQQADNGDVDAQLLIGMAYMSGANGLPQNFQKAVPYLLKAGAHGHALASLSLSYLYLEGLGVSPNLDEARLWANRAKSQGSPEAQEMLKAIDAKRP